MTLSRRSFLSGSSALGVGLLAACEGGRVVAPGALPAAPRDFEPEHLPPPSPELHLLKRATWGATPDAMAELRSLGAAAWIERQLNPGQIDDSAVEKELAERWTSLSQSACELDQQQDEPRIMRELREATLFRRVFSQRQLYEVMVDFWTDHFNVFHGDGLARHNKTAEDRDVIRSHALGEFRDMLHASARSPAMLHYLDNASSTKDKPNENYARELLELHTLGVDGGYTENDVKEVARAFTGWKVRFDRSDTLCLNGRHNSFWVNAQHDLGEKVVLGHRLPAGRRGEEDGAEVLDILVDHPSTRRFLALKLCRRLVADQPPAGLVDRVAGRWGEHGDIRAMLREILLSTEFAAATDAKLARPQEFAIATVRALAPEMDTDTSLQDLLRSSGLIDLVNAQALNRRDNIDSIDLGDLPDTDMTPSYEGPSTSGVLTATAHVPFQWPAPDGFPDLETYWASAAGLLERWKFALAAAGQQRDGQNNARHLSGDAASATAICDALSAHLLQRELAASDREAMIVLAAGGHGVDEPLPEGRRNVVSRQLMAMLLISPYMQRR